MTFIFRINSVLFKYLFSMHTVGGNFKMRTLKLISLIHKKTILYNILKQHCSIIFIVFSCAAAILIDQSQFSRQRYPVLQTAYTDKIIQPSSGSDKPYHNVALLQS